MKRINIYIICFLSFLFLFNFLSFEIYTSIGFAFFMMFSIKFILEIGEKIEIRDVMILIALLQWVIGPYLAYIFFPEDEFYYMAVDLETYMSFVIPASTLFIIGLYIRIYKRGQDWNIYLVEIKELLQKYKNLDVILIILGLLLTFTIELFPTSIRFAVALISFSRFIGLYMLLINENRKRKLLWVLFVTIALILASLRYALFHDLILWIGFFLIIAGYIYKPIMRRKLLLFFVFINILFVIQTVKYSYREALTEGNTSGISLFSELIQKNVLNTDYVVSKANISAAVTRINQGWIIARIMSYTPLYEPFAKGETIKVAIKASLLPRFLFPEKIRAGGRTYFERFTGKPISENTSMGLSLLGEAYANYGVFWGAFFMFIIGLFYNIFLGYIFNIAKNHPSIVLFIPLIFLQVIKAETDFSVILNHLIKASIAVWILYWSLNRFFRIKL